MKRTGINRRVSPIVAIATLMLWMSSVLTPAHAAQSVPELRVATAINGYEDVQVLAASWQRNAPRWTRASRVDVTLGVIRDDRHTVPLATAAPVWAWSSAGGKRFLEFSIGPTVLGSAHVGEQDLGGNFHFRSSLAIGATFGNQRPVRIALRISHISNGVEWRWRMR